MCNKRSTAKAYIMNKDKYLRLDSCIARFIEHLNLSLKDVETVGSCCGHGIYPMTIIVKDKYNQHYDLVSGVQSVECVKLLMDVFKLSKNEED